MLPGDLPAHSRIGLPESSTLTETRLNGEQLPALRAVCPFRLVVDEDMDQLNREITMIEEAAGSTLFEEGDPADGVAAILEGSIEILKQGRVLATLGPGSLLGELSVFVPSGSRTATARATSPVRMITWRAHDVQGRLARHERLATAVVADMAFVLAERLDRRTQDVVRTAQGRGDPPAGGGAGALPQPGRGVSRRQGGAVTGGWGDTRAPGCGRQASGPRAGRGRSRLLPRGSGWSRSARR